MGTSAYNKYPPECTFDGKKVLNIGCGYATYKSPNVVNLDAYGDVQVKWDLGDPRPLPFPDGSFDYILANHILEHVPNWWHCFEECSRVLKVGGIMEIWLPGPGSDSVLGFRDHINTINHCSWWGTYEFVNNPNNAWAAEHAGGPAASMKMIYTVPKLDHGLKWLRWVPKRCYPWIAMHLRNVIKEMGFVFQKVDVPEKVRFDHATVEALI